MKTITKKCCGLDVHKESIFASISQDGKAGEVRQFTTMTTDISQMAEWLQSEGVEQVAMESTGIYWIPIWNILDHSGFKLTLVNPYLIKQMPGRKSDIKDSQWIARLLDKDMLRSSFVPNSTIVELRSYTREHVHLQGRITRIAQTMEHILEQANIRISSLTSSIKNKTVINIIELIIAGETRAEEFYKKVHGQIKNRKGDAVMKSLEGYILPQHIFLLRQKMEEYKLAQKHSVELTTMTESLCDKHYKQEIELLQTMPGVAKQGAMLILAETGADMSVFETSSKLTGWAGLRPRNDESAGKIKSKATTKGNKYLRRVMVQAAWASTRTKGCHFQTKYQQLAVRKGNKKALIAIARKQLTVTWNILSTKMPYDPTKQPVMSNEQIAAKKKYLQKELQKISTMEQTIQP